MTQHEGPGHDPHRDDEEISAEFARILGQEGMALRPGTVPREPPALPPVNREASTPSAASPSPEEIAERRARARAAHPSFRRPPDAANDLTDDEALSGDFVPPQPELTPPATGALYSWGALLGGIALMLLATFTDLVPTPLGLLGAVLSVGGIIALLLRVPRSRPDDTDDGAQV